MTLNKPWPWSKVRKPTPADWGLGMTVCIAGFSSADSTIVCVTDSMVAMSDLSMSADDSAFKTMRVGDKWNCLLAGDLSAFPSVRHHMVSNFSLQGVAINNLTVHEMASALKYAFEAELKVRAEADILGPYGLTFGNYRDEGPKLGPDIYSRILFDLHNKELGLKMLVAGFDPKGRGHLFTVEGRGLPQYFPTAFWAIGSGDLAALGQLYSNPLNWNNKAEEIFYRVCWAKFAAETSPGVGKKTSVLVQKSDGGREMFYDGDLKEIRRQWNLLKKRTLPLVERERIKQLIAAVAKDTVPC